MTRGEKHVKETRAPFPKDAIFNDHTESLKLTTSKGLSKQYLKLIQNHMKRRTQHFCYNA